METYLANGKAGLQRIHLLKSGLIHRVHSLQPLMFLSIETHPLLSHSKKAFLFSNVYHSTNKCSSTVFIKTCNLQAPAHTSFCMALSETASLCSLIVEAESDTEK